MPQRGAHLEDMYSYENESMWDTTHDVSPNYVSPGTKCNENSRNPPPCSSRLAGGNATHPRERSIFSTASTLAHKNKRAAPKGAALCLPEKILSPQLNQRKTIKTLHAGPSQEKVPQ